MGEAEAKGKKAAIRRWPVIAGIVVALALVVALAVFAAYRMGLVVPGDAAAKYAGDSYISEVDVADYIASYRRQQGLENSSDEAWASFLADNDQTPDTLRLQTIQQFVIDEMVKRKAAEHGVSVDEGKFREYLDTFKGNLAFGDDDIYRETLEMQGQTVEQAEEGFRSLFLQRALFEVAVPVPEPDDDEIKTGLANAYPTGVEAKHIYRFTIQGLDEDDVYEHVEAAQIARQQLLDEGLTAENFERLVVQLSNDEALVAADGDDGWSIDDDSKSSEYQATVEDLSEGELSNVFSDDDGYTFLWVDRAYLLEPDESGAYDLEGVPDDLLNAVSNGIAQLYWQLDCQVYLQELLAESNLDVFPMPVNVPYNVDMSLAEVQLEEVAE